MLDGMYSWLIVIALVLFTTNEIASFCVLILAEFASFFFIAEQYSMTQSIYMLGTDVIIYAIGLLVWTIVLARRAKKNNKKLGLKSLVGYKLTPIKLAPAFKIVLYCSIIIVTMSMAKSMDTPLLACAWTVLPTFIALALMLRLSDVYILEILYQIVLVVITYMGISIGKVSYTNYAGIVIVTVTSVLGYIEYRRMLKERVNNA